MRRLAIVALFIVALLPAAAFAASEQPTGAPAILAAECLRCRGEAAASGLDLRTRDSALRGGPRGPAIVPGRPEESLLHRAPAGIRGQGRDFRLTGVGGGNNLAERIA